jgi:uncharacterized membrane protein YcaP (DUF421 family)
MDLNDILAAVGRTVLVYVFVLVIIRLLGKREIGNFSAFDFLVALMIGEVVDEIIYANVSIGMGFAVIGAIGVLEYVNSWATYKSKWISKLTSGSPTVIIERGHLNRRGMAQERISEEEIWANLRMQGITDLKEVKVGTIETDGEISFVKEEWAQEATKGDLQHARSAVRS